MTPEGGTAAIIRLSRAAAQDIPPSTHAMARLCLLDWLGLALAGMREPVSRLLLDGACAEGARATASILGEGRRFSARQAALVNGVAGHALDYDDVNLAMNVHPTAVLMPAILALAQTRHLSGTAMIEAFVVGYEAAGLIGRLMARSHYARGFHATGTIGCFGATAACAQLIGLSEEATARAYGLAGSQAAGLKAQFGTMAKPLHAGRAAEAGVMAALWAERGMTARPDVLEARQGFAATQSDGLTGAPTWEGYELDRNLFKFHAACFGTHGTLEAIGALRKLGVQAQQVRAIRLRVHAALDQMCNIPAPRSGLEAKFSLRFNAALAISGADTADIATYADGIIGRPGLDRIRRTTSVEFGGADWPEDLTEVTIELQDGSIIVHQHDMSAPPGDLPAQAARLRTKFHALAAPIIGEERAFILRSATEAIERSSNRFPSHALLARMASMLHDPAPVAEKLRKMKQNRIAGSP
jgi:2-methylcitrate dehydratase PrpD